MAETFLNGKLTMHPGDCLGVLPTLEESSIDSCVTDPPYHLTSIVKRFGAENAAPAAPGVYGRASRGFMGKQWDGGEIAFEPETWAAVLRVLKPGGHLLASGAPKNFGFMQYAIAQAGFEIRDCLAWMFGSGFPKSHNIQKSLEGQYQCQFSRNANVAELRSKHSLVELREETTGFVLGHVAIPREAESAKLMVIGEAEGSFGQTDTFLLESMDGTFLSIASLWSVTSADHSDLTRKFTTTTKLRTITDSKILNLLPRLNTLGNIFGAGTALKPAYEPIIMARKPLIGTVAANVELHGTGAINIDACRVGTEERLNLSASSNEIYGQFKGAETEGRLAIGRWPANVIHDGSDEVVGAFPESNSGSASGYNWEESNNDNPTHVTRNIKSGVHFGDSGSAARFFYTAKADSDDRLGSKHPTVKPLDLMQYLVRLVTPKGGLVLDPFAGTGTTGEAAWREGMRAVLIEREPEYQDDIRRRMKLCLAGPDERARETIKQKTKDKPAHAGPLFSEIWEKPFYPDAAE